MSKSKILILFLASLTLTVAAQNPIVPAGVYIADPSAHVWNDGRLYVYGSLDESTQYYCSWRHHVLATDDMKTWTFYKDRFASKGDNDQLPETDALLFAPDCQVHNGVYYLYYCLPDPNYSEGVATSSGPVGPFTHAQKINLYGYNEIDPCVFIDDDGQAYYLWGQFTAKMAKLKPNLTELDQTTLQDSVITEDEHHFHEGGYLVKRNGIYYFIYAHMGRSQKPTCLGYATSSSPMGPYKYGGVIIDNDNCDPGNWNNHGSLVEFRGRWYVFYHRATHNSNMMRKACVEPISFNADGSINEVEMTSQGAGGPLDACKQIDAERACLLTGNVRIQAFAIDNEELGEIRNGDRAAFKYIDFGKGTDKVIVRAASGINGGKIELVLDYPWRRPIGVLEITGDDEKGWREMAVPIEKTTGVHALWLRFSGQGDDLFAVDWLKFAAAE